MTRAISILALLLAIFALLMATRSASPDKNPPTPPENHELLKQLETLRLEHRALIESNRLLSSRLTRMEQAGISVKPGSFQQPSTQPAELELELSPQALARLKSRLDDLTARETKAARQREIDELYGLLNDPSRPVDERIRMAHKLKSKGTRDERVIKTMADLYRQGAGKEDTELRLILLDTLGGIQSPDLRDQVLADLGRELQSAEPTGVSIKFRHTAVESLKPMISDPAVQQWLNYLVQNDPDRGVADHAAKLLKSANPPVSGR